MSKEQRLLTARPPEGLQAEYQLKQLIQFLLQFLSAFFLPSLRQPSFGLRPRTHQSKKGHLLAQKPVGSATASREACRGQAL